MHVQNKWRVAVVELEIEHTNFSVTELEKIMLPVIFYLFFDKLIVLKTTHFPNKKEVA